jgi:hypothetical protein
MEPSSGLKEAFVLPVICRICLFLELITYIGSFKSLQYTRLDSTVESLVLCYCETLSKGEIPIRCV